MAYIEYLDELAGERLSFCGFHPRLRRYIRLDRRLVFDRIAAIAAGWKSGSAIRANRVGLAQWRELFFPVSRLDGKRIIVKVSPDHLEHRSRIKGLVDTEQAPLVIMIHDLLPIEYPEFSGRGGDRTQQQRLKVVAEFSAHIVANSQDTADSIKRYFGSNDCPPVTAIPLGFTPMASSTFSALQDGMNLVSDEPYFVCIGTIEPRKNHMMLLHLWRQISKFAELHDTSVPKLYIVGRRGWENENIIDLLERSPFVRAHVIEAGEMGDEAVARLLFGARALLAPSFAEGFGLPVAEALACGIPVICSDIAPHREIGGEVPDYVDPLDGPTWQRLIFEYACEESAARDAQLHRLRDWSIRSWDKHIHEVYDICKHLGMA
ncbi:glycosyltransferase family 1 protein [Sphingobium sp. Sx8-8]|uniref:glycosyltransferase family 4 protein n=1 Tax=Sphingobium sp. Sx8-8 TaxID=2933617 RepID=UPI001F596425|nr:glycosyltransferase family 1 protein [Sphingobium sp. Sx8-8]